MVNITNFERYLITEQIKESDWLIISQGKDTETDEAVIITAVKPKKIATSEFLARFEPLAKPIGQVDSPHVAKMLAFGEVKGQAVIIRESLEGKSLASMLAGGNGLPLDLALDIARQLGEYLDALHRQGILQMVFSPEEISLSSESVLRVMDLGLAQGLNIGELLSAGKLKANPYHAPELLRGGQGDSRTDFYSLGAVLFTALTGKEPDAKTLAGKTPTLSDFFPSRLRPGLPPELDELVAKCLHPDLNRRIQSAAEFLNKVEEVRRGMAVGGRDTILGMEGSLVGQTLGTYRLVERLGQGGMATVYKAYEAGLDRYVAVKVLPQFFASDPSFTQRFRREAKAVAQLGHPNIVPIYNYGEEGGITYIAMQFMEGGTLKRERGQVFSCEEALRLLLPITRALGYAHARGIVHRDIKPSNVLLTGGNWPVLADFGLAQMAEASTKLTGTGVGMGTPAYMSPEQGQGAKVDARTDIYSLGIMLYEMVTGDVPFKADTPMAIVIKHLTAPMPLPRQVNPAIPKEIEEIILKATSKDPAGRFQSAEEMASAMDRALNRVSMPREKPAPKEKPPAKEKVRVEKPRREEKMRVKKPAFRLKPVHILVPLAVALLVLGGIFGPRLVANLAPEPTATATATATAATPRPAIIVTSAEDSGAGTLRQALLDAQAGDTITFDPVAFPPEDPVTITLKSGLPAIVQGYLTLDASNAGVNLDGSQAGGEWTAGIEINSEHNIIKGLLVVNFTGSGILLNSTARFNTVGGDRTIGLGPLGEGNLFSHNSDGVFIQGSDNVITGNLIGTDKSGSEKLGNRASGIVLEEYASRNMIGPNNIIAFNGPEEGGDFGVYIIGSQACANTITANSIHDNSPLQSDIAYQASINGQCTYSTPPILLYFDLDAGKIDGQTCKDCVVEIFSTETQDGKIYEGTVTADEFGNFSFSKGVALTGPYLTATATRAPGGNTSEFSQPTSALSAIQIALDAIKNEAPIYQISFDFSWDREFYNDENAGTRIDDGKLIVIGENLKENRGYLILPPSIHVSDMFAVEFDFRILESTPDGSCSLVNWGKAGGITVSFLPQGQAELWRSGIEDVASSNFDISKTNTLTLISFGEQIATFINGQFAATTIKPEGTNIYPERFFSANNVIVCEYDNYKIWDLSGVDFNP